MRAPKTLANLVEWRWTPAAALLLAAVLFVALAVTVIPERIGALADSVRFVERPMGRTSTSLLTARVEATFDGAERERSEPEPEAPPQPVARRPQTLPLPVRRGFSPPLPRPEPEVPPAPPPQLALPVQASLPLAREHSARLRSALVEPPTDAPVPVTLNEEPEAPPIPPAPNATPAPDERDASPPATPSADPNSSAPGSAPESPQPAPVPSTQAPEAPPTPDTPQQPDASADPPQAPP